MLRASVRRAFEDGMPSQLHGRETSHSRAKYLEAPRLLFAVTRPSAA